MDRSPVPLHRQRILVALCVTVIVSYGVLYYAFTVLAPDIVADTGWSSTAVTSAFSVGSLTGAAAGVVVGRVIQRHGPRWVMTGAGVLASLALVGVALAPSYSVFLVGWIVLGAASAGLFYPPAFAALTGWFGERRVQAITVLTLAGGLASTVFAPVTAELMAALGWRKTYLVLAVVLAVITVPLHAVALRGAWPSAGRTRAGVPDREVVTSPAFLMLALSTGLVTFASFASIVHLVPLLTGRGLSTSLAAWALGLGGVGQVAGRVFYPWLARVASPRTRTVGVIAAVGLSIGLLAVLPGPAVVLIGASVVAGIGRGLFTLVSATLVIDHWGAERYAALNGVFSVASTTAMAIAPVGGAVLHAWTGSYAGSYAVLAGGAAVGAVLAALASTTRRSPGRSAGAPG